MKKINIKGFTLVELLATIIVLAIVVGITIPLTLNGLNKAKEKERQIIVRNIRTAVGNYVQECYSGIYIGSVEECRTINHNGQVQAHKTTKVSDLIEYGFLSRNSDNQLLDPVSGNDFANCELYIYDNGEYGFCGIVTDGGGQVCPRFDAPELYDDAYCWAIAMD